MRLVALWEGLRRGYRRVNASLEQFYHHGPAAHGIQGVPPRIPGRSAGRCATSYLGFLEFRRECRHLRAARQALAARDGVRLIQQR
ncbi:MAG: hypothetical protein A3G35_09910 [candidate division NC10 bacterium RIFCSPLOWO2_12_FULL_66_18]|nr:MAG: hypothetical protein A3H39_19310 [candidate division NC10 bacterium RIFCSPLOWO2_02_FULL_66_22]OGC02104.1 MAG: hypothetical protein A3G35_09910 [candidate division NC10 bacterium RIFCSPLOWO2_12_FULL_66_18]